MNSRAIFRVVSAIAAGVFAIEAAAAKPSSKPDWVEPMTAVHARFSGKKGTFAQFGDSITVSMAFWSPLSGSLTNLSPTAARALAAVKSHMNPDCWSQWKGPQFGNQGSMTIRWADENIDQWIERLQPEVVVLMFGSNDVGQLDASEYEAKTRRVVRQCLARGAIVLLTTAPPRSGRVTESARFAECVRRITAEEKVPLIDYFEEIMRRRPADWDGSLPQFKNSPGNEYEVPTLIARDGVHPSNPSKWRGDYSEAALDQSGFALRNYLTLLAYSEVIREVLRR